MAGRVQIKWHGWVVLLAGAAAALAASTLPVGRHVDLLGYDLLMAATVRAPAGPDDVAVVGIDDDDTISSPQLREEVADIPRVMRRDYLAKVLDSLLDAGAAGIGLDIVLSSSVYKTCDKEADHRLKGVLRKARMLGRPVVLGFYPASPGKKSELPHDYFLLSADRVGFLNFDGDLDEKRRSVILSIHGKDVEGRDATVHPISYELAALIKKDLPFDNPSHLKIDYRLAPVSRYAFWDIYSLATQSGRIGESKLSEAFANKIVFVGYTFRVEDEHTIPVNSNIVSGQNRPPIESTVFTFMHWEQRRSFQANCSRTFQPGLPGRLPPGWRWRREYCFWCSLPCGRALCSVRLPCLHALGSMFFFRLSG
jgi:CHASE2 domain-containing sensor protein